MLCFENVSVLRGRKTVLQDVNARIEQGKLTVLVGKNGSGKSSLLSCLTGLVRYTGKIWLDGEDLSAIAPRKRAQMCSLMPQLLPDTALTTRQLAVLGREPYLAPGGKLTQTDREAVENAICIARMENMQDTPVNRLSGGERRLAFLAMTAAQDTPLMLFDEPTAHLDADHAGHFLHRVRRLIDEQKKTAVLVLHDLTAAVNIADYLLVIDRNTCVFCGTREEFLEQNIAQTVFNLRHTTVTEADGRERILFYM